MRVLRVKSVYLTEVRRTPENIQRLINSGMAWKLEGSIGRAAMAAIEDGLCMLGRTGHYDYWGNYVPARDGVRAGTKGSYEYVLEHTTVGHTLAMSEVDDNAMNVNFEEN